MNLAAFGPTRFWLMYPVQIVGASLLAMAIFQTRALLRMYPEPCGSWLASDGARSVDGGLSGWVHIHFCGNGCLGFRPDGDSLF